MDLEFSPADQSFRAEVRAFIGHHLPRDLQARARRSWMYTDPGDAARWQRILHDRGWAAPSWPAEFGGPGWSASQRFIFEEECAAADCPRLSPFGLTMVGPVIYTFGDPAQKDRYLPPILSGDETWCQGYSEPGAGSDLAALSTRAVRHPDHYLVNGQKTWTSGAHRADRMFCLARTRTDAKPQQSISFLLVDMKAPGVSVDPIISMDHGHYLNSVFLQDVVVPVSDRVGAENEGWTYAKFLLGNERTAIAGVGRSKRRVARLKQMARSERGYGLLPLIEDGDFRRRLAEIEMNLQGLEMTSLRSLAADAGANRQPGPIASILKIQGTEIEQAINELMVEALGYYALPYDGPTGDPSRNQPAPGPEHAGGIVAEHLIRRAASIFGGTNEIQKNIIAKVVLGL